MRQSQLCIRRQLMEKSLIPNDPFPDQQHLEMRGLAPKTMTMTDDGKGRQCAREVLDLTNTLSTPRLMWIWWFRPRNSTDGSFWEQWYRFGQSNLEFLLARSLVYVQTGNHWKEGPTSTFRRKLLVSTILETTVRVHVKRSLSCVSWRMYPKIMCSFRVHWSCGFGI